MKRIVIIGGGFAGSLCAQKLEKDFDVTLIDTKNYFEFSPSVLRTIVDPKEIKKIQSLHSHYLHKSHIVKGRVTKIEEGVVHTTKKSFEFDYLIITAGSSYASPIKGEDIVLAARGEELRNNASLLKKSSSVLIIGGGVVGVELAAEIVTYYPEKKITLVHSKSQLMERSSPKAQQYVLTFLRDRGVTVLMSLLQEDHQVGKQVKKKSLQTLPSCVLELNQILKT